MRALVLVLAMVVAALPRMVSAESDETSPLPSYLESVWLRAAGDLDGAVASLERARALAPSDADLALELARVYAADRRYGDAAAAFEEAADLAPDRPDLALDRARFHLDHAFRLASGLRAAEMAVQLAPGDPAAIVLLDRARALAAIARAYVNVDAP